MLSPILLLLFVWFQAVSKNSPIFLWFLYSSFIFLALATLFLVSSNVEHASKGLKRLFYIVIIIALLVSVGAAFSIGTFPPGGARHYFGIKPNDVEIDLEYGLGFYGKSGYSGGLEQTILNVNYPVGGVYINYELYGVHVFTSKSVISNVTVWFSFYFWPNQRGPPYDAFYRMETGTALHNGTESYVEFRDYRFLVMWGSSSPASPERRERLDKGYRVTIYVAVEFEGPYYGSLKATIPLTHSVYGDDVEVSSQFEDGIAILLCGICAEALLSITIRQMKPKIVKRLIPIRNRISKFSSLQPSPSSLFKKCVECQREIPIAAEECQHCGAKQNIERKT
jgi:hypothetical protein